MDSDTCFDNYRQYSCVPPLAKYKFALGIRPIENFDFNMQMPGTKYINNTDNSSVLLCKQIDKNIYKCSKTSTEYNKITLPTNNNKLVYFVRDKPSKYKPNNKSCKKIEL